MAVAMPQSDRRRVAAVKPLVGASGSVPRKAQRAVRVFPGSGGFVGQPLPPINRRIVSSGRDVGADMGADEEGQANEVRALDGLIQQRHDDGGRRW
ncbi:hypothetical protein Ct61P_14763 [Colletotrichum tofieldiae]|nr:hypothetical protein Ct61P_14763 [Colletotrichum tofieldiae]